MAATNGRTDVLSETGEIIRSFSATLETGETVSMEILPSGEAPDIGLALRGVLAEIEQNIDKTEIQPFEIATEAEREAAANALIEDRREEAYVEGKLKFFADAAYTIHRTITGKRAELKSYATSRATIRDAAISSFAAAQARKEAEENERIRQVARQEEEARRKEEAAELERRAKTERRPDLKQRAEEIKAAPIREVAISTRGGGSLTQRTRGASGGSVGLKKAYVVDVLDEEALILAAARPHILREVVYELDKLLKKKGDAKTKAAIAGVVTSLRLKIDDCPQIPLSVLEPVEQRIKDSAKANDGKINWPGVAISEDLKTQVRK